MPSIHDINLMKPEETNVAFEKCCGAQAWYHSMTRARPFSTPENLFGKSSEIFATLSRADWMQAFAQHPKIGDLTSLRAKFPATRQWAEGEQSSIQHADNQTLENLASLNAEYEAKFGYIFIVCATGKSAREMLTLLIARLPNEPDLELKIAGAEQEKITHLRLGKLLIP